LLHCSSSQHPGPVVTLLITTSISRGKRAAFFMIPGIFSGDLAAMLMSFAGVGALFLASPTLYTIVRFVGSAYLIYLGAHMWAGSGKPVPPKGKSPTEQSQPALKAFWVTILNPKSFLFFVAFMPQFVNKSESLLPQFSILAATYLGIGLLNDIAYTLLSNKVAGFLSNLSQRLIYRIGATNLIVAGIFVISLRHS